MIEEIIRLFPDVYRKVLIDKINVNWSQLQEIRIRIERPIELTFDTQTIWIEHIRPSKQDGQYIINQLSQFSLYRLEEELKQGYITIQGGHRVGLAGKVNTNNGSVKAIKDISSFNIRIAKQKIGIADPYVKHIYQKRYLNTLIIGAPQTGKTTLLRDVARIVASGWGQVAAMKVGIVDERSEIAGCIAGIPQYDIGVRSDVLDACPKAEGMMMLIRSMSPDVLIVDEIGSLQDVSALQDAIHAGVSIICTAHGHSLTDLRKRSSFAMLLNEKVFDRYIILHQTATKDKVSQINDRDGNKIVRKVGCENDEMDRGCPINMRYNTNRF